MCEPLTIASAALTAAGAGASLYGQKRQQDAYNAVQRAQEAEQIRANQRAMQLREQERARQQGYQDQSAALLNESQKYNSVDSQNAQEAAAREALANQYSSSADKAADVSGIPGLQQASDADTTPRVVADTYKQLFGNVGDYLRQQAGSKAALDTFGNSQRATTVANARQLQQQGLLGNFMQGSTSVLANELAGNSENSQLNQMYAARAGDGAASQAAIFNGLGSLGMNLGTSGLMGGIGRLGATPKSVPTTGAVNSFLGSDAFGAVKPTGWASMYPSTGLGPTR